MLDNHYEKAAEALKNESENLDDNTKRNEDQQLVKKWFTILKL